MIEREINSSYLEKIDEKLSQIYSSLHAKFFKVKKLKKNRDSLKFQINTILFLPNYHEDEEIDIESDLISSLQEVEEFFQENSCKKELQDEIFNVITSVLEGAGGIVKPAERYID